MQASRSPLIRLQVAIPPTLSDAELSHAIERYQISMGELYRFKHGVDGTAEMMLALQGDPVGGGSPDPPVYVTRHRGGRAAHNLDIVCVDQHHDLLTHELECSIRDTCSAPPGFRRLDGRSVPAQDLGAAIGPSGAAIKKVHPLARLLWDTTRPLAGEYARWVPR